MPKTIMFKGEKVHDRRAETKDGKKTGMIKVFLVGPPKRMLLVSAADWDKHKRVVSP